MDHAFRWPVLEVEIQLEMGQKMVLDECRCSRSYISPRASGMGEGGIITDSSTVDHKKRLKSEEYIFSVRNAPRSTDPHLERLRRSTERRTSDIRE